MWGLWFRNKIPGLEKVFDFYYVRLRRIPGGHVLKWCYCSFVDIDLVFTVYWCGKVIAGYPVCHSLPALCLCEYDASLWLTWLNGDPSREQKPLILASV